MFRDLPAWIDIHMYCISDVHGGQKRAMDSLQLEL